MRIAVAVAALGGLLVWEAWSERARHRIALLLERLPALLVQLTVDLTAWQLAMVKMAEQTAEAARLLEHHRAPATFPRAATREVSGGYTITRPDRPPQVVDMADVAWSVGFDDWSWTLVPDDSWIDSYSGRGEELEALEQVIEEQRRRIGGIR